ncbi:MAG: stage III sporulation protein AD [Clostridia bacterium]|nr:stage III sporulation protein AD [Clostridia bacterium]
MNMYAVVGLSAIVAVLAISLKKYSPEYSILMVIMTGIFLLCSIMQMLNPIVVEIKKLSQKVAIAPEYISILGKVLVIAFLTQFSSDTCIDAGQTSLAAKIELAGKVLILSVALPLFTEVVDIVVNLVR